MVVFGGVRLRSEDRQRGRLSVVVYGLCVQRVQVESRDCVQHRLVSCDVY